MAQAPRTIDARPTWAGIAPALAAILTDGDSDVAKDVARSELYRMARLADGVGPLQEAIHAAMAALNSARYASDPTARAIAQTLAHGLGQKETILTATRKKES
jgi:hypothetical protein